MASFLSDLFPFLYAVCLLALLWQAFRIMGRGFRAVPMPGDRGSGSGIGSGSGNQPEGGLSDRTGRLTIHPELLDADGQLTSEDLLTVRFGEDQDAPTRPGETG